MTKAQVLKGLRQMAKSEKAQAALMDSMENRMITAMRKAERKILRRMTELVSDMPSIKTASNSKLISWYAQRRFEIQTAFIESGYTDAVAKYMAAYPDVGDFVFEITKHGMVDQSLVSFPKEIITQLKRRDAFFFKELNTSAFAYFDRTFLNTIIAGDSKYNLLGQLKGVITGDYKWGTRRGLYEWHAGTYARTMHRRYSRSLTAAVADENGLNKFLYTGPVDAKVRRSCQRWVYQIFTREEIDGLDNGQTGDVMVDGGGYNCRHNWRAISDAMANGINEFDDDELADAMNAPPPPPPPPATVPTTGVPQFKTHKEAAEWMPGNLVKKGGKIQTDGLDLPDLQVICDELYAMRMRHELPMIKYFTDQGGSSTWAGVGHPPGFTGPNTESSFIWSAANKSKIRGMGLTSDQYAFNVAKDGYWAAHSARGLSYHESIHYWQVYQPDDVQALVKALFNKAHNSLGATGIHDLISEYAHYAGTKPYYRPWEFLAESMVKMRRDGTGWIPDAFKKELLQVADMVGGY